MNTQLVLNNQIPLYSFRNELIKLHGRSKIETSKSNPELPSIMDIIWKRVLCKASTQQHAPGAPLTTGETKAKEKALKILEQEQTKTKKRESTDLFPERYTKEEEGRVVHKELCKQNILQEDFGQIYFGYFKSKDAFAFMKLHGCNGLCRANIDYRDYSDEIFKNQFVFADGHVFWK